MTDELTSARSDNVFRLISEFSSVEVSLNESANGPRLQITDIKSGVSTHLDPLVLESLVYVRQEDFAPFLDPGQTRWAGPYDE
jgi:hypothetical protein